MILYLVQIREDFVIVLVVVNILLSLLFLGRLCVKLVASLGKCVELIGSVLVVIKAIVLVLRTVGIKLLVIFFFSVS